MADTNPYKPFLKIKTGPCSEDVHYSLLCETIPEEFKKVAEEKLNETEDSRRHGLQHLREFISKQNLPFVREEYLLTILRQNKYKLEKADAKIKNFCKWFEEFRNMLSTVDMKKAEKILNDGCIGALPYRDKHGRLILYNRPCAMDLEAYTMLDMAIVFFAQVMFLALYPLTSVAGVVHFGDCYTPSIYLLLSIHQMMRKILPFFLKSPCRGASMEVLNENIICRCFLKIVRPMISKKLFERINWHGSSFDDLHADYHPDMLPDVFGGNLGPLNNDLHKQKVLEFIRTLKEEKSCKN